MTAFLKKSILAVLLVSFIFMPVAFRTSQINQPQSKQAFSLPLDYGLNINRADATMPVLDIFQLFMDQIFDILLETLKLAVVDMLVNQIVAVVQGQNSDGQISGGPQFITSWLSFLGKRAQAGIDAIIGAVDTANICAPFASQLRRAVRPASSPGGTGRAEFKLAISCNWAGITLNQATEDLQSFYNDFSNGGWDGYASLLQPQNNFYGGLLQSLDREEIAAQVEQDAGQNEGLSSRGYLGTAQCSDEGGIGNFDCIDRSITTPGDTFAAAVDRSVGSRIDYIVNAQSWPAIVAVVVEGFMSNLISGDSGGLLAYEVPSGSLLPTSDFITSFLGDLGLTLTAPFDLFSDSGSGGNSGGSSGGGSGSFFSF